MARRSRPAERAKRVSDKWTSHVLQCGQLWHHSRVRSVANSALVRQSYSTMGTQSAVGMRQRVWGAHALLHGLCRTGADTSKM